MSKTIRPPGEITHYYSLTDQPFQNLSDLEPKELEVVLSKLNARRAKNPQYRRLFGKLYMDLRRRTEEKMRTLFKARGGKPERKSPHYFVLGECPWFSGLYPDPASIRLDWQELPFEKASFTYPDSFVSMRLGEGYGLPNYPQKPYHEQVFLLDELPQIIRKYGLPDGSIDRDYDGYHKRDFEKYVEVQLWSDDPITAFMRTNQP